MEALKELIRQCLAVPQIGRPEYTAMVGKALQEISDRLDALDTLNDRQQEINKEVIEVFAAHEKRMDRIENPPVTIASQSPVADLKDIPEGVTYTNCDHEGHECCKTCVYGVTPVCIHDDVCDGKSHYKAKAEQLWICMKKDECELNSQYACSHGTPHPCTGKEGHSIKNIEGMSLVSCHGCIPYKAEQGGDVVDCADYEGILQRLRARLAECEKERDHYKDFCGSQRFASDFQNADQMREALEEARKENAELKRSLKAQTDAIDMMKGEY